MPGTAHAPLLDLEPAAPARACLVVPTLAVAGLSGGLSYAIPEGMDVRLGDLVAIDLRGTVRKGIVIAPEAPAPGQVELKPLLAVYPAGPLVTPEQMELAAWLARSYHASLFSAIRLCFWDLKFFQTQVAYRVVDALGALRVLTQHGFRFTADPSVLTRFSGEVVRGLTLKAFWKALDLHGAEPMAALPLLLHSGALALDYRLRETRHALSESWFAPSDRIDPTVHLTPAESALWERLQSLASPWQFAGAQSQLDLKNRTAWNSLIRKGYLLETEEPAIPGRDSPHLLTRWQRDALEAIVVGLDTDQAHLHLLQGITGSGKTEVYLRAAREALKHGVVLYLVPEIALTPQTLARVEEAFGTAEVGLLHSAQTDRERRAIWEAVREGRVRVVVGPRSALFAPAAKISLIVLDEEHDSAYKQQSNPRYHARTAAQKLAELHGAVLVLGSATPALETYRAAQETVALEYHVLPERAGEAVLPTVEIVPLDPRAMEGTDPVFTSPLRDLLGETFANGQQALLFLNRRGTARSLICVACRNIPHCPRCDIALTVHQSARALRCHHCGHSESLDEACQSCGKRERLLFGFGTEQVERSLTHHFPGIRVGRLDRDVVTRRGKLEEVLGRFAAGEFDALVGTQMIAKGLDLPNLAAVGVLLADQGLTFPDFRAGERTFQLLTQVAGRAGRRSTPGRVIIQTFRPDHPIIQLASQQDYPSFALAELAQRKALYYPPYCRLTRVLFDDTHRATAWAAAHHFARFSREALAAMGDASHGIQLLGPAPAPLARLKLRFRVHVLIKSPRTTQAVGLIEAWEAAHAKALAKSVRMQVDVDALDLL